MEQITQMELSEQKGNTRKYKLMIIIININTNAYHWYHWRTRILPTTNGKGRISTIFD